MIEPVTILLSIAGTLTISLIVLTTITSLLNGRALTKAQHHLEGQDKAAAETQALVDGRLGTALAELEQSRAATLAVNGKLDIALARIISLQEFIDGNTGAAAPAATEAAAGREERAAALLAAARLAAAHLAATAQVAAAKVLADKVLADAPAGGGSQEPMPVKTVSPETLDVHVVDPATPSEENPHDDP